MGYQGKWTGLQAKPAELPKTRFIHPDYSKLEVRILAHKPFDPNKVFAKGYTDSTHKAAEFSRGYSLYGFE